MQTYHGKPHRATLFKRWQGYIDSTHDALLVFEACHQGILERVKSRIKEKERSSPIQSGAIYVYDEQESGIKRWTDGLQWTPSRILGSFLIYRELEAKHVRSNSLDFAMDEDKTTTPSKGTTNLEQDGLIKKTMSITVDGYALLWVICQYLSVHQHLVCYYRESDVTNNRLIQISSSPELGSLQISQKIKQKQRRSLTQTSLKQKAHEFDLSSTTAPQEQFNALYWNNKLHDLAISSTGRFTDQTTNGAIVNINENNVYIDPTTYAASLIPQNTTWMGMVTPSHSTSPTPTPSPFLSDQIHPLQRTVDPMLTSGTVRTRTCTQDTIATNSSEVIGPCTVPFDISWEGMSVESQVMMALNASYDGFDVDVGQNDTDSVGESYNFGISSLGEDEEVFYDAIYKDLEVQVPLSLFSGYFDMYDPRLICEESTGARALDMVQMMRRFDGNNSLGENERVDV